MKRALIAFLSVAMAVASCTKESKEVQGPYNPDGSLITQAQALEIVKDEIEEYDVVYVSKSIVKKGTKFTSYTHHDGIVPCDAWIVVINTEPLANSGAYWLYIYIDSYTGDADNDSWEYGMPEGFDCDMIKYNLNNQAGNKTSSLTCAHAVIKAMSSADASNYLAAVRRL